MFNQCVLFHSDVSQWNVSRAANQSFCMFSHHCPAFDRELGSGWPLSLALRRGLFLHNVDDDSAMEDELDEDEDEEAAKDENS
jgi:hypothetical protein